MQITKQSSVLIFVLAFIANVLAVPDIHEVGYKIAKPKSFQKIKTYKNSALYVIQCEELDDDRPIKLLDLHGSHFQTGYAYAKLMAKEIESSYIKFFHAALKTEAEIKIVQLFLDWQFEFVSMQIPSQFFDQLKGLAKGGKQEGVPMMRNYFERVLVISTFPGALQNDVPSILADQFIKYVLRIKSPVVQNIIQNGYENLVKTITKLIKQFNIQCSFYAVWGERTANGKLYTMRNLDWFANTGVNENKLITVWNIDGEIAHLTLGYPGILGALTGMSKAGLTVHEAGLSSHRSTELGFQWTLRMRYIMMKANNLAEAKKIWLQTNNTLGMNYMIGSASDNTPNNHPALVMQTMRGYTAFFHDNDIRENGTVFTDPETKKKYVAGYSMPEAVFRTNHAYDPTIRSHMRMAAIPEDYHSILRYKVLKNGFNDYKDNQTKISFEEAVNLAAMSGDKGTKQFLTCQNNSNGTNVISVVYEPESLKMWVAFEYGFEKNFKSACCGVYVQIDMGEWWRKSDA